MIPFLIVLVFLLSFLLYTMQKRKRPPTNFTKSAPHPTAQFQSRILEKPFPDRIVTIQFHGNAIKRGFANGDLAQVNLSYAKLIEAIRQQNENEKGAYEKYLSEAREEYHRFREVYGVEYPQQFLPLSQRKLKSAQSRKTNEPILFKSDNTKLMSLIKDLGGIGHPEYPLLRRGYAIESGIKCKDFSSWVIEQLRQKDYDSLYAFVREFYLGRDLSFEDNFKEHFSNFLRKNFAVLFDNVDPQVILEIQAFFSLEYGFDDFNREFWIVEGKQGESLAKILSVYQFSVNKLAWQPLINKANHFLKEMRKDQLSEYWLDFKDYNREEIKKEYKLNRGTDLAEKLKKLPPGERLHFFDFARKDNKYWNGNSSYTTKSFGIDERQGIADMVSLEIYKERKDLDAIPEIATKSELKEVAERAGLEVKKSWTLQKIYENLRKTTSGEKFLAEYLKDKTVILFNQEYRTGLAEILENQQRIKRLVDLIAMM